MKNRFKKAVLQELISIQNESTELLTEEDISHLPGIVKKYIRYTGSLGKEKPIGFRSVYKGGIRFGPKDKYMPFRSEQYDFMSSTSRLFYIKATKMGLPAVGLHLYQKAKALFKVKLLGLFTVVDAKGPLLDKGETVTVLNDWFVMAPGALIDPRIQWEVLDEHSVKATFTNQNISISAKVVFDEEGRMINFLSNDRSETDGKEYVNNPWETPISEYVETKGYRLPAKAKMIYKRPEGDFCYGEFELVEMDYNPKVLTES